MAWYGERREKIKVVKKIKWTKGSCERHLSLVVQGRSKYPWLVPATLLLESLTKLGKNKYFLFTCKYKVLLYVAWLLMKSFSHVSYTCLCFLELDLCCSDGMLRGRQCSQPGALSQALSGRRVLREPHVPPGPCLTPCLLWHFCCCCCCLKVTIIFSYNQFALPHLQHFNSSLVLRSSWFLGA